MYACSYPSVPDVLAAATRQTLLWEEDEDIHMAAEDSDDNDSDFTDDDLMNVRIIQNSK